jgi:hypothetical protein
MFNDCRAGRSKALGRGLGELQRQRRSWACVCSPCIKIPLMNPSLGSMMILFRLLPHSYWDQHGQKWFVAFAMCSNPQLGECGKPFQGGWVLKELAQLPHQRRDWGRVASVVNSSSPRQNMTCFKWLRNSQIFSGLSQTFLWMADSMAIELALRLAYQRWSRREDEGEPVTLGHHHKTLRRHNLAESIAAADKARRT